VIIEREMSEPDELFSLRSLFYSGAFQQAIAEASGLNRLSPHLAKERDEFLYRSHVALGQYDTVIRSIGDDSSVALSLRAIKLLATFMRDKDTREIALLQLQEWMQDLASANDTTLQTVAATMRMHNDEALEAIKILHHGTTLEQLCNPVLVCMLV
jgi:coatomer protein complex subunit epsilon